MKQKNTNPIELRKAVFSGTLEAYLLDCGYKFRPDRDYLQMVWEWTGIEEPELNAAGLKIENNFGRGVAL
jgi:hypothetical protein